MIEEVTSVFGTMLDVKEFIGKIKEIVKAVYTDQQDLDQTFKEFFKKAVGELGNDWYGLSPSDLPEVRAAQADASLSEGPHFWWKYVEDLKEELLRDDRRSGQEIYDHIDNLSGYFQGELEKISEELWGKGEIPEADREGLQIIARYLDRKIWNQMLQDEPVKNQIEMKKLCDIHTLLRQIAETVQQLSHEFRKRLEEKPKRKWNSWEFSIPGGYKEYVKEKLYRLKRMADAPGVNAVFIYGEHGMGKTVLAKLYAVENYKSHVLFTEYKGNFKNTVESLYGYLYGKEYEPKDGNYEKSAYQMALEELRRDPVQTRKWLVVIDNFNNDESDEEDQYILELQGEEFQDLLNTGVHMLITTTITADIVSQKGMHMEPLEDIKDLYEHKSETKITEKAEEVINLVKKNTLIVTLTAGLVKKNKGNEEILDQLINAFKEMSIQQIPDRISDEGGRVKGKETLYEHMKTVFNAAKIQNVNWIVMENAALLPLSGMSREEFLKKVSGHNEKISEADIREGLETLIDESWISEEKEGDESRIFVHPMVREIVNKDERFSFDDCRTYGNNLLNQAKEDKKEDYYKCLAYAENLYENWRRFSRKKPVPFEIIETGYVLTEIYEETGTCLDQIFELTERVLELVKEWSPQNLTDQIRRCRMISGSAYSMLHTDTADRGKKAEECERCREGLLTAVSALRKCTINELGEDGYNKWLTRALIHGNMGAYYRAAAALGNGEEREPRLCAAVREHRRGLKIRETLKDLYPDKAEELEGYIATAHHCIGRDLFDLGKFKEALEEHMTAEFLRRNILQNQEIGQQTKWIQSCEMICETVQAMYRKEDRASLEELDRNHEFEGGSLEAYYHQCYHCAKTYYKKTGNRKELQKLARNYKAVKPFFNDRNCGRTDD